MEKIDITPAAKNNVNFRYYRENTLYYETFTGVVFSVPIDDIGTATFNNMEKGLLLMRWMKKHNKEVARIEKLREESIDVLES